MPCHTACGQWVVLLVQSTVTPPRGGGLRNTCNARAHQLGGRGVLPSMRSLPKNGSIAMPPHTAWGQWAVQILQCTATLLCGSAQCNSCSALPH